MEHDVTWWHFLPGYQQLQEYFVHEAGHATGVDKGVIFGNPMVIQHVFGALLVCVVVLLVALSARRGIKAAPDGGVVPEAKVTLRGLVELGLETLYGQMRNIIGADAKRYFPVISTLALFILFSNLLGLVPGFSPPTNNWNTTFGCGIFVFLYYNWHGLRTNGIGHIAHMANPTGQWWGWFMAPLMFPIELVSHIARPCSLGIRLAANMVGDHAVLAAFLGLVPVLVPLPFLALGLMVCVVQTFVFVLLTMIYIGLATAEAHHEAHEGHEGEHAHAH